MSEFEILLHSPPTTERQLRPQFLRDEQHGRWKWRGQDAVLRGRCSATISLCRIQLVSKSGVAPLPSFPTKSVAVPHFAYKCLRLVEALFFKPPLTSPPLHSWLLRVPPTKGTPGNLWSHSTLGPRSAGSAMPSLTQASFQRPNQ